MYTTPVQECPLEKARRFILKTKDDFDEAQAKAWQAEKEKEQQQTQETKLSTTAPAPANNSAKTGKTLICAQAKASTCWKVKVIIRAPFAAAF